MCWLAGKSLRRQAAYLAQSDNAQSVSYIAVTVRNDFRPVLPVGGWPDFAHNFRFLVVANGSTSCFSVLLAGFAH
jgi:hypothetical protein